MDLIVTPIYTALLALLFIVLSIRVILLRRDLWISLGDKGNPQLLRRQRVHGNFAEYVPFALLLMVGAELMLTPKWIIHALGVALLLGRLAHAYGVSREPESLFLRSVGMVLTFIVLFAGALTCLVQSYRMAGFAG
ncbi:MAPEG family protein [Roseibium sp. CAU 1637]|uniref:MAPEG family protein n=1 Tax=Roseibium limicola TaxID=2816037 RepID=A0A939ERG3_9HYPH|nr:MAPEG family protein [Roseibium limicola]MBO0345739.1 MAPEG family protein [Roseibium limicola]